ncbi:MAG TPA: hypothetical protein P5277_04280 [Candidatus Paceibacterota bacterium]|nr:hypothetical protein [Candidatus Paceibacterota bacterium]
MIEEIIEKIENIPINLREHKNRVKFIPEKNFESFLDLKFNIINVIFYLYYSVKNRFVFYLINKELIIAIGNFLKFRRNLKINY